MFLEKKPLGAPPGALKGPFFSKKIGKNVILSVCIKNINQLGLFEAQNDKLESEECLSGEENLWGPL